MDAARSALKLAKSVTETVQPMEVFTIDYLTMSLSSITHAIMLQLVTDEDERRLMISVTKYQTLSMQQGKKTLLCL
jgi:hypothetical protein